MCVQEQANNFISKFDLLSVRTGFDYMGVGEITDYDYVPICVT